MMALPIFQLGSNVWTGAWVSWTNQQNNFIIYQFMENQFVYLSMCLSVYLFYLSIYISVHLSIFLSVYLSICLSVYLSICLSVYLSICLSVYLSICLYEYLSIYPSFYLSICLSVYCSICLSVCLSNCLFVLSVYLSNPLGHELNVFRYPTHCIRIILEEGGGTCPSRFRWRRGGGSVRAKPIDGFCSYPSLLLLLDNK